MKLSIVIPVYNSFDIIEILVENIRFYLKKNLLIRSKIKLFKVFISI